MTSVFPVQPQGTPPLGNTDTFVPEYTSEIYSITTGENGSVTPSVIFGVPEVFSVTTSDTSSVEIYGFGVREAYSVTSSEAGGIDLAIDSSRLIYYNPVFE